MPQISVLMPVYNVAPYLTEAVESILQQTFGDFEIILVDDGSTDGTAAILSQMAARDERVQIHRTPRNLGLPQALNFGLTFCTAPFIARMDGDDIALPTKLEKQLRFLEANPAIALVSCGTRAIDQNGCPIAGLAASVWPTSEEQIAQTFLISSPCPHTWMARRALYEKLSGYRLIPTAEDYDFLLRALSEGYRISNLAEPLLLSRTRPGNISSRLEQRKTHYYVIQLYRERRMQGHDSYSAANYQRAVACSPLARGAYRLAMRCLQLGLCAHNRLTRILFILLSALLSPWQARYCIDRIRVRLAMRVC